MHGYDDNDGALEEDMLYEGEEDEAPAAAALAPYVVRWITFAVRDGADRGTFLGFWTGEVDTWGKRTIRPVDGRAPSYLFDDEIVRVVAPAAAAVE